MPKRCQHCKIIKPLTDFNKCRTIDDGHHAQCKACRHKYYIAHAKEIYKKTRQYAIKWNQTPIGKDSHHKGSEKYRHSKNGKKKIKKYRRSDKNKKIQQQYIHRYPEKAKAHSAVYRAVKTRKLLHPSTLKCFYCPKWAQQYHHPSYAPEHWFDVEPICRKCHRKLHKAA